MNDGNTTIGLPDRGAVPATKLQVPAPPATLVHRPRLLELLTPLTTETPPATLVCAAAGSGKTTLIAEWARTWPTVSEGAIGWVSIGPEDNEPFVLWSSILVALERSGAWPGESPLARVPAPTDRPGAEFMVALLDAFAAASRAPVILVLDDVHLLTAPAALGGLDLLLRSPPANLHLMLAARFEPALSLPRLRLEGRLRQIDPRKLDFTADEADLLLRSLDVQLPAASLDKLLAATEGWAAGLRLAATSLVDSPQPAEFVITSGGDDRTVADYLGREVLAGQEPHLRQFLLDTSVADALTADLARALSGREDAGALLDELDRTNSLVSRLDHERYRYHPMLRRYLRTELARQDHKRARRQHQVAAGWFESAGENLLAVEHAATAGDHDLLSTLLRLHGTRLVTVGQGARVRDAIRRSGADGADAVVALVGAAVAMDASDPASADLALAPLVQVTSARRPSECAVRAATSLAATVALQRARIGADRPAVRRLLRQRGLELDHPDLDLLARLERGLAWYWLGHLDAAEDHLRDAEAAARTHRRDWLAMRCLAALADVALARCEIAVAASRAHDTLVLAEARGWSQAPAAAAARVVLGWVAFHASDDAAGEWLSGLPAPAALADATQVLSAQVLAALARFGRARDRHAAATEIRVLWEARGTAAVQPQLAAVSHLVEQRMVLEVGENTWAAEVADRAARLIGETGDVVVLRAVATARRGRFRSARHQLARVVDGEVSVVSPMTTVTAWLWEATLAQRAGESGRADGAVAQAVAVAAPLGLMLPFVFGSDEVSDLLSRAAGSFGHDESFVERVRSAARPDSALSDVGLTTRELELLTELPSMRTAEEIAAAMLLSVNTVKTHIRGIYRKLGVTNRRDAVVTARRRGLL